MESEDNQDKFLAKFLEAVLEQRFTAFVDGATPQVGLARYLWNIQLCEAVYPVFHTLEVGLRNAVHREVGKYLNVPDWLGKAPGILHAQDLSKVDSAMDQLKRSRKDLDEGHLVAELSFGFWTSLLDSRYETLWHKIIKGVAPYMPKRLRTRSTLSAMVQPVRKVRNLAFHHHAIWDRKDLLKVHSDALTLLGWMSPSLSFTASELDRFPEVHSSGLAECKETAGKYIH